MVKQEVLAALDAARGRYISGQELAAQLSVSRTAVWKAVAALRRDGIPIKAVTNRGYTLAQSVDVLNAAAVATQLDEATVKALQIEVVDVCHRRRGFNGAGYHFYIRKNGDIKSTRPIEKVGAHAKGFNRESIGICYEGGLDSKGRPKDTRTEWQKHSLRVLILTLLKDYPGCRVCGHRDLSPDRNENGEIEPEEWVKACPCFDAENNWKA